MESCGTGPFSSGQDRHKFSKISKAYPLVKVKYNSVPVLFRKAGTTSDLGDFMRNFVQEIADRGTC